MPLNHLKALVELFKGKTLHLDLIRYLRLLMPILRISATGNDL